MGKGVCQGYILSNVLFKLYAEYIMQKTRLDETQAGIQIAGRNINNFRYADNTTLMTGSKEELKNFPQFVVIHAVKGIQFSSVQLLSRVQLFSTP